MWEDGRNNSAIIAVDYNVDYVENIAHKQKTECHTYIPEELCEEGRAEPIIIKVGGVKSRAKHP